MDRETVAAVTQGLTPEKKARAVLFLSKFERRFGGHGPGMAARACRAGGRAEWAGTAAWVLAAAAAVRAAAWGWAPAAGWARGWRMGPPNGDDFDDEGGVGRSDSARPAARTLRTNVKTTQTTRSP